MIKKHVIWFGLGAALAGGALALGPGLEPPAGAVADTAPSLAAIESKIDALSDPLSGVVQWESARFDGRSGNGLPARLVEDGSVLLHKLIISGGTVVAFDGPGGNIDSAAGSVEAGAAIADLQAISSSSSSEVALNVVANNGLYIAFRNTQDVHVTVLYRPLD